MLGSSRRTVLYGGTHTVDSAMLTDLFDGELELH